VNFPPFVLIMSLAIPFSAQAQKLHLECAYRPVAALTAPERSHHLIIEHFCDEISTPTNLPDKLVRIYVHGRCDNLELC
jgi:hypothetical protein